MSFGIDFVSISEAFGCYFHVFVAIDFSMFFGLHFHQLLIKNGFHFVPGAAPFLAPLSHLVRKGSLL
jgi:hypothetical protein